MTLRTHRFLHIVRELDVGTSGRKAHRLEVVHPAHALPALHGVSGKIEISLPVCDKRHTAEIATGRMPTDKQPVRISVEACRVFVSPGDSATDLIRQHP